MLWLKLSLALSNVNEQTIKLHDIDYATIIISELTSVGLGCVEWNGKAVG